MACICADCRAALSRCSYNDICISVEHDLTKNESYVTTDGQPASLSWYKAPIWGLRQDLYYLYDSYGLVLVGRPL
jgi:hypothetical protein